MDEESGGGDSLMFVTVKESPSCCSCSASACMMHRDGDRIKRRRCVGGDAADVGEGGAS